MWSRAELSDEERSRSYDIISAPHAASNAYIILGFTVSRMPPGPRNIVSMNDQVSYRMINSKLNSASVFINKRERKMGLH